MARIGKTPRRRERGSPDAERVGVGFRRGEAEAIRRIRQRVRRIISFRGYGVPREDRRDLEQVVMTQLWQSVQNPETELGSGFWAFVETVTARRVIDWRRVHREQAPLDAMVVDRSDPLSDTLERERADLARATLVKLPEKCRQLIQLHLAEGRIYREISEILAQSEGALRVQMYRCIRRARELLDEPRRETRREKPTKDVTS